MTVLEGHAEALVGGDLTKLGPLDSTFVPAEVPHCFRNIGAGKLVIPWIDGARDVTRAFTEIGKTVANMSPLDQV